MDEKISTPSIFREKLETLLKQTSKLIIQSQKNIQSDESAYSSLTQTVYEIEKVSDTIIRTSGNEDLIYIANLVKNILEQPLYPKSLKKRLSFLSAAKLHKNAKNSAELKELLKACIDDPIHTEVFLEDLKDISESIKEQI